MASPVPGEQSAACELLLRSAHLATMVQGGTPYGALRDGAIAIRDGRIVWLGRHEDLPTEIVDGAATVLDLEGRWVTPGLVDSHTHLVFAGHRSREFEMRLGGARYEEIARAGGGILSTVEATRAASESSLVERSRRRLEELLAAGVTTVEIKSGYGLDLATETKMLRVARTLGEALPVTVQATLLAAHAIPKEFSHDRMAYIELVCEEILPTAAGAGLVDAVDAFCEQVAFTPQECARVFDAAARHGLPVRLHADQLSNGGGAALAARHGARSADHLEYASTDGVQAMAGAGTVAVLLPGAFYFLGQEHPPPVKELRDRGVPIAVASDMNPGTSPVLQPLFVLNLACVLFGLTPEEALAGMTRVGARALGMENETGTLEVGKWADLAVWDVDDPAELSYWIGSNPCVGSFRRGAPARAPTLG